MSDAFEDRDPGDTSEPLWTLGKHADAWKRSCLRAAMLARPDLVAADAPVLVFVTPGHWAEGILPVLRPGERVEVTPPSRTPK